jgi:predicted HAD superfamily phosphohydrolase YqeG
MFIQEGNKKVIFNMNHYKMKRENNKIIILDMENNPLGTLIEYQDEKLTKEIFQEVVELLHFCKINKTFCLYNFPQDKELKKVVESERK